MIDSWSTSMTPRRLGRSLATPVALVGMLVIVLAPLPTAAIDLLLAANLALAAVVLLTAVYVRKPSEFSALPSLLLGATLFRLSLNIATTRLILTADASSAADASGAAGRVIESFASFVAGGSLIVGLVLFAILVVVQFVVVTKGAERISEVAARFTLDALPGKQLAIDAERQAGLIDESEARERRAALGEETDFYGAMDGASKFVRGDAIAGVCIIVVNLMGGLAVGLFEKGWGISESASVFSRLTIGDGLVSQIPAVITSVAAALVVTRSGSGRALGDDLADQLAGRSLPLALGAGFLVVMAMTGLPAVPLLMLAAVLGGVAWMVREADETQSHATASDHQAGARGEAEIKAEAVVEARDRSGQVDSLPMVAASPTLLPREVITVEVGMRLIPWLSDDGVVRDPHMPHLPRQLTALRERLSRRFGLPLPPLTTRDQLRDLPACGYRLLLRDRVVAQGQVRPGKLFVEASAAGADDADVILGQPGTHPVTGAAGYWQSTRMAGLSGEPTIAADRLMLEHLEHAMREALASLLTREMTAERVEALRGEAPRLCDEVLGSVDGHRAGLIRLGRLQRILQAVLADGRSLCDLEAILEAVGDVVEAEGDEQAMIEASLAAARPVAFDGSEAVAGVTSLHG